MGVVSTQARQMDDMLARGRNAVLTSRLLCQSVRETQEPIADGSAAVEDGSADMLSSGRWWRTEWEMAAEAWMTGAAGAVGTTHRARDVEELWSESRECASNETVVDCNIFTCGDFASVLLCCLALCSSLFPWTCAIPSALLYSPGLALSLDFRPVTSSTP